MKENKRADPKWEKLFNTPLSVKFEDVVRQKISKVWLCVEENYLDYYWCHF